MPKNPVRKKKSSKRAPKKQETLPQSPRQIEVIGEAAIKGIEATAEAAKKIVREAFSYFRKLGTTPKKKTERKVSPKPKKKAAEKPATGRKGTT